MVFGKEERTQSTVLISVTRHIRTQQHTEPENDCIRTHSHRKHPKNSTIILASPSVERSDLYTLSKNFFYVSHIFHVQIASLAAVSRTESFREDSKRDQN